MTADVGVVPTLRRDLSRALPFPSMTEYRYMAFLSYSHRHRASSIPATAFLFGADGVLRRGCAVAQARALWGFLRHRLNRGIIADHAMALCDLLVGRRDADPPCRSALGVKHIGGGRFSARPGPLALL